MPLQRVHMLLDPQQRSKLADIAKLQGRSIAEVTRQAINMGLEQMPQVDPQERMLTALESAQQLRERMHQRNGQPLDMDIIGEIRQMREQRDEEIFRRSGF